MLKGLYVLVRSEAISIFDAIISILPVIIKQKWKINVLVRFIEPVIKQYIQAILTKL